MDADRARFGLGPSSAEAPTDLHALNEGATLERMAVFMAALSGRDSAVLFAPHGRAVPHLREVRAAGRLCVIGTRPAEDRELFRHGLVPRHAYHVVSVEDEVLLRNSWGHHHPWSVGERALKEYMVGDHDSISYVTTMDW